MPADDIVELNQLAYRYAAAVDACDVSAFQSVFASDANLRVYRAGADAPYTDLKGHDQLALIPKAMRGMYLRTAHMMTNHLVDVRGNAATGEVLCIARHLSADPNDQTALNIIIRYRDRYIRLPEGWRISEREIRFQWSERSTVLDSGAGNSKG